jgi:hypothetical protein
MRDPTDHTPSGECAEQAAVRRLFQASMDVYSALGLVGQEGTRTLLRQVVDNLDLAIRQVQVRALDLESPSESGPQPAAELKTVSQPAPSGNAPAPGARR